jgi:hypothetical protein
VNEMNAETIDGGLELRPLIELGFAASPSVVRSPIGNDLLKLPQRRSLLPTLSGLLLGPPRELKSTAQIGKSVIRRAIGEGN